MRVLLLGDLEPPAQRELARSPAAAALKDVDVLKVAHHGSAHQDFAFLRRIAPRLALISCGEDNTYGHPAPGTVAALRAQGATVLRTDRSGSVAVAGRGGSCGWRATEGMDSVPADACLRRLGRWIPGDVRGGRGRAGRGGGAVRTRRPGRGRPGCVRRLVAQHLPGRTSAGRRSMPPVSRL